MAFPLIITLIIALVIIVVTVSAVQQHKERVQALKRAEFTKLRHALEETEEILFNAGNAPLSNNSTKMLLRRSSYLLKAMVELEPAQRDLRQRLKETETRLTELNAVTTDTTYDHVVLPDNDQQLIAMVKGMKKLRAMLRAEHARGNAETQMVIEEDRRLDLIQLRISIESQIKRGKSARSNNMLGSSRQFYEKALNFLTNTNHQSEFIATRLVEVKQALEEITAELKQGNAKDIEKRGEKDNKDINDLFAPKKKW